MTAVVAPGADEFVSLGSDNGCRDDYLSVLSAGELVDLCRTAGRGVEEGNVDQVSLWASLAGRLRRLDYNEKVLGYGSFVELIIGEGLRLGGLPDSVLLRCVEALTSNGQLSVRQIAALTNKSRNAVHLRQGFGDAERKEAAHVLERVRRARVSLLAGEWEALPIWAVSLVTLRWGSSGASMGLLGYDNWQDVVLKEDLRLVWDQKSDARRCMEAIAAAPRVNGRHLSQRDMAVVLGAGVERTRPKPAPKPRSRKSQRPAPVTDIWSDFEVSIVVRNLLQSAERLIDHFLKSDHVKEISELLGRQEIDERPAAFRAQLEAELNSASNRVVRKFATTVGALPFGSEA